MALKIGPILQQELIKSSPLLQELRARRKKRQGATKPDSNAPGKPPVTGPVRE